ncbi:MAG: sugar transferase, partial [Chitinophagaceae bacterium]
VKNSPNIGTGEITLRNDPRVTRFGRFLRRTKINELPQVFNVLKGDMSIVGPRPLMQVSFDLFDEETKRNIYKVRPGITGIASLVFRDEEKILSSASDPRMMYRAIYPYKASLETWYSKNMSFSTDALIIIMTAWSIVSPSSPEKITSVFKDLPPRMKFS